MKAYFFYFLALVLNVHAGEFFSGVASPLPTAGGPGDFYLSTQTGSLYKKHPTLGWQHQTVFRSLRGAPGTKGDRGADGASAPVPTITVLSQTPVHGTGKPGDLAILQPSGFLYFRTATHWQQVGTLKGEPGPQGVPGVGFSGGKMGWVKLHHTLAYTTVQGEYQTLEFQFAPDQFLPSPTAVSAALLFAESGNTTYAVNWFPTKYSLETGTAHLYMAFTDQVSEGTTIEVWALIATRDNP